jgi:hypothetical protein
MMTIPSTIVRIERFFGGVEIVILLMRLRVVVLELPVVTSGMNGLLLLLLLLLRRRRHPTSLVVIVSAIAVARGEV